MYVVKVDNLYLDFDGHLSQHKAFAMVFPNIEFAGKVMRTAKEWALAEAARVGGRIVRLRPRRGGE